MANFMLHDFTSIKKRRKNLSSPCSTFEDLCPGASFAQNSPLLDFCVTYPSYV